MQISPKIHELGVSIYNKSGMMHVNQVSRDFATTPNGQSKRSYLRRNQEPENEEISEFEMLLDQEILSGLKSV